MPHAIYILQSEAGGSFYIGSSAAPVDRLAKHNRPHKGYTASRQPWKLVFIQWLPDKTQALKLERTLKAKKSKDFLFQLILSQDNDLNS